MRGKMQIEFIEVMLMVPRAENLSLFINKGIKRKINDTRFN